MKIIIKAKNTKDYIEFEWRLKDILFSILVYIFGGTYTISFKGMKHTYFFKKESEEK